MSDEELMRELAARFYQKGWLRNIEMSQGKNKLGMKLDWTESGRETFMSLHALLDELGFIAGAHVVGEINILFEMITDKESSDLSKEHHMRPFLQSYVNTRMGRCEWIRTEEENEKVTFVGWTEKGLNRKRRFQELLEAMNCAETFVKESEGIFMFTRACASSAESQSDSLGHKRF
jgi:hypothetical protein